jgi:hypothetical protein
MHVGLLAYYGGPDQIMVVTSGFAGVVGLLLMFWNKVVATFFRVVKVFRPSSAEPVAAEAENDTLKETP